LLLFDDDRLSKAAQYGITTVNQLELCHIDRALMMGNHHRREIAIGIASRLGRHHPCVHTIHGPHHLRRKRQGRRIGFSVIRVAVMVVLRERNPDDRCDK
jgi:hypothetical protein